MKKLNRLIILALSAGLLLTSCKEEAKDSGHSVTVNLSTSGNEIKFEQKILEVPFGKEVTIEFRNLADYNSEITHNVAVVKQGFESLVLETLNKEGYEFSKKENHFSDKDYFETVSNITAPTKSVKITFKPQKPGFYTYICLMPGHGNILNMMGKLYVKPVKDDGFELKREYVRPKFAPFPENNQYSLEKFKFGKSLFFDPILSRSKKISCATCHNPAMAFQDGLKFNVGDNGKTLARTTPTLLNLAWSELFFWDGRSDSLEEQALDPIESSAEMNLPLDELVERVKSEKKYAVMFAKAFPGKEVNAKGIGQSIATFQRTLISKPSRFDQWIEGDEGAMSLNEKMGFELFNGKAKCAECHSGWRFTDDSFHDIGLKTEDTGRGKIINIKMMQFAFKTPTLRDLSKRAPFMHDGQLASLSEVVDFYDVGGNVKRPSLSSSIVPLKLTGAEKGQLLSFLKTLDSPTSEEK